MSRRRYVARGAPGGYRIWDNRSRRYWGELYQLCPDDLLTELNGAVTPYGSPRCSSTTGR